MITPAVALAPALADPEVAVALATVAVAPALSPSAAGESGVVELSRVEVLSPPGPEAPPARFGVPVERAPDPFERDRDGSNPWNRVCLEPGATLVVALSAGEVVAVKSVEGVDDPALVAVRAACALARQPVDDVDPRRVRALAGDDALAREALLVRLGQGRVDLAVEHLAAAVDAATAPLVRGRLRDALAAQFDPERWASRDNAAVLTALARALLAAPRAERLAWAGELARWLRYPYDPAPERQERVARALVLLVDAPPVAMVAALEGLGGAGTPEDQAAARDVLALWLQL